RAFAKRAPDRRGRFRARPDGRRTARRPAPEGSHAARGPDRTRARGARIDGRRALEQGDRRAALHHRAHGGKARQEHLRHSPPAAVRRRPPSRPGRRHLPERGLVPASPTAQVSGHPAGQAIGWVRRSPDPRRSHMSIGHWSIHHPRRTVAAWLAFVAACVALGAISGIKTLDNGAVGESARGYAIMNKDNLWGAPHELAYLHTQHG